MKDFNVFNIFIFYSYNDLCFKANGSRTPYLMEQVNTRIKANYILKGMV